MAILNTPTVHDLFLAAYELLGGRLDIKPDSLLNAASCAYVYWRDTKIEEWATAVYDKHGLDLLDCTPQLMGLVERLDEFYYVQCNTSDIWADNEDTALGLAHMVAVIRWYSNVHAGRVHEVLPATAEDARQWLDTYAIAPVKAGQMSLFLGV